jgi:hypothetical protein
LLDARRGRNDPGAHPVSGTGHLIMDLIEPGI